MAPRRCPLMLRRKFAVIKLWPELKTAEDECIARLKMAALDLGLECIEVDSFARTTALPRVQLTNNDIDFVLSLHFETPKCYDIFSFVALWNPLQFDHEWGYRRFTEHLLTHDDFLSCSSPWADDHVARNISGDLTRDRPAFHLYHSLGKPLFGPTTGEGRIFYSGINWERIQGKRGRHDELLRLMDKTGFLRIYGPKKFQGVDVWAGYRSYVGPLPFDGVSVVREINRAGIGLALSSAAHIQSELMSNRLFECVAAGAVTICDENPFGRRYFGDSLLYIDCTRPPKETLGQIVSHVDWIRTHPDEAIRMAAAAQEIFRQKFSLSRCLEDLYNGLERRKEHLSALIAPAAEAGPIDVLLLMPEFSELVLARHIESCLAQRNVAIRPVLVMNSHDAVVFGERVRARLSRVSIPIRVETAPFFEFYPDGVVRSRNRMGRIMSDLIRTMIASEYFTLVGPHERLFTGHFAGLLKALEEDDSAGVAASSGLYRHNTEERDHAVLREDVSLGDCAPALPLGYGRFLIRRAAVKEEAHAALRYLDALAIHLLVAPHKIAHWRRPTVLLDLQDRFNLAFRSANPDEERQIVADYVPGFSRLGAGQYAVDLMTGFERLAPAAKTKIAVELAHSVPVPERLKKLAFGVYRWWLKRRH